MLTLVQMTDVLGKVPAPEFPLLVSHYNAISTGLIAGVGTDTRQLKPGQLFVAIRGDTFDGNQMALKAAQAGAAALLMDDANAAKLVHEQFTLLPIVVVRDTRQALGVLARFWRQQFNLPVIGVCGSNGKTTVKEMINAILIAQCGADHVLARKAI